MTNLVLVVEDDHLLRMQICDLLEQAGYQVAQASNGVQALIAVRSLHPDIVLLDAVMPIMDGFSCCSQIKALGELKQTPVLMITGIYDHQSVEEAFAVGADDFITKPLHWPVLNQRLRRLLADSRIRAERQQTLQALEQTTTLQQAILASANYTIISTSRDGKIITFNATAERWLGYTAAEVIGKTTPVIIHDLAEIQARSQQLSIDLGVEIEPGFEVLVAKARRGETDEREWTYIRKDGSRFPVLLSVAALRDQHGNLTGFMGIASDITARKQAEAELQRQNMRSQLFADITCKIRQSLELETILQTAVTEIQTFLQADRVIIFKLAPDNSGTILKEAVVPGCRTMIGRHINDSCFSHDYHEKYRQGRISAISDITKADYQPCHIEFLQQLGVQANLVVPIFLQAQLWGLLIAHQCRSTRQWQSFEIELLQQLADQISIALTQALLLEQETKQRQELARSNAELQQFASVASHDLQEPLRKILAFGNLLKATSSDILPTPAQDYVTRMQNAAERMQVLIEDLLTLSRVTTKAQPFTPVNLTQVAQEVLSDLEVRIQQTGGYVELGYLPTIHADEIQMRQLLQNLIGNALKFHRPDLAPLVKVFAIATPPATANTSLPTQVIQLLVKDNGIGFDEKYLDRIFNVFQRLHSRSEYEGTGIGLAICRKIAERHGGNITANSQPGQGATFVVTLKV